MYLLNLTTSVALAFVTCAMAQIQSTPGFTTTSLFMPGATFTPYLTSLGSNDGTTTWGAANSSAGLETPYLLVTLGPTNMLFSMTNTNTKSTDTVNNIIFSTLAITSNCPYTTFSIPTRSTQTVTARCTEISNWIASNVASANYKYTDLPESIPSQVSKGFDGYNAVYVKASTTETLTTTTTKNSAGTSPNGVAATNVAAWAWGAGAMAAGAAALVV